MVPAMRCSRLLLVLTICALSTLTCLWSPVAQAEGSGKKAPAAEPAGDDGGPASASSSSTGAAPSGPTTAGPTRDASGTLSYPACSNKPTEGDTAAAKGAFQAGTAAYNEADYDRAATYWEDAFRRDCTASALLLNLARAYESGNKLEYAIVALQTYNERNPDSPQHGQIERRIERLREQLDAQAAAAPVPVAQTQQPSAAPKQAPPESDADAGKASAWPLVVAISGGAIALVGTGVYIKGKKDTDEYESQCGADRMSCPTPDIEQKANDARKVQQLGGAMIVGGAVIGVGGAVWYYFETRRAARARESAALHFVPALGPGYAGVSVDGRLPF